MRLDMLIRLIMRALCRGAYQQCVRYCGTGVIVAAAFAPPIPSYRAISEPLFHARDSGGH